MTRPKVGVLGASGDIGRHIVDVLLRLPPEPLCLEELRLAARRPNAIALPLPASAQPRLTRHACDVRDHDGLARFSDGLDVVINATGPSHERAVATASIVLAAGAHYVDVGGPADARTLPLSLSGQRTALFYAGALPGAAGIVPRWLLNRQPQTQTLTVITGGRGAFTRAGAEDYLAGLKHGDVEPLAAWRNGERISQGARREHDVLLDGFADPVSLLPYFDAEAEAIARQARLVDATWYSAMIGDGVMDMFLLASGMSLEAGSIWLRDASVALAAGGRHYVVIFTETEHEKAMLHAPGENVLAAEIAATAALEVLTNQVDSGCASAASVLDPDHVLTTLTRPGSPCTLVTSRDAAVDLMEEGAL